MSEKINFRTIWHSAGVSAIVLAAVSSAYFVFNQWLTTYSQAGWATIVNFIADLIKIVACIWLLRLYLYRFRQDNPSCDRRDLRRLGTTIAFLSALIYAAVSMAYFIWNPEVVETMFDTALASVQNLLDANSRNVLEYYRENFPKGVFVSQLLYCFFIGWVLTCILASRIISDNPFEDGSDESKGNGEKSEDSEELFD